MKPHTILDLGMKLHVPYNNDFGLIERITELADYVSSVYLPCNLGVLGSGRFGGNTTTRDWSGYDQEFERIVKVLGRVGIKANMLFNSPHVDSNTLANFPVTPLYSYIRERCEGGLEWVTVSNIELARLMRQWFPGLKIDVSVIAGVANVEQARYWCEIVQPELICVDPDQNRNLAFLRELKAATGIPIKLLANSYCLPDCPYKMGHYMHFSQREVSAFECWPLRARRPWHAQRGTMIPPYYLREYAGLIADVKVVDRSASTEEIIGICRHYAFDLDSRYATPNGGVVSHPDGTIGIGYNLPRLFYGLNCKHPLLHELAPETFRRTATCRRNCESCRYCYERWRAEWNVEEDAGAALGFIGRQENGQQWREFFFVLHSQRHNLRFLRTARQWLGFFGPPFDDICRWFLALAFAEASEPDLSQSYATAIADEGLARSCARALARVASHPWAGYGSLDDLDVHSFRAFRARKASREQIDRVTLIENYLFIQEPDLAEELTSRETLPPSITAQLGALAARNDACHLALKLLSAAPAEALSDGQRLAKCYALYRCGEEWKNDYSPLSRKALESWNNPWNAHAALLLTLERGSGSHLQSVRDLLLRFVYELEQRGEYATMHEVVATLRRAFPDDVGPRCRWLDLASRFPVGARSDRFCPTNA